MSGVFRKRNCITIKASMKGVAMNQRLAEMLHAEARDYLFNNVWGINLHVFVIFNPKRKWVQHRSWNLNHREFPGVFNSACFILLSPPTMISLYSPSSDVRFTSHNFEINAQHHSVILLKATRKCRQFFLPLPFNDYENVRNASRTYYSFISANELCIRQMEINFLSSLNRSASNVITKRTFL